VVGQASLKLALTLCAVDPGIAGVLIRGPRGVAKTTLARALGELVPGPFVELPLGATEERVTGSLDLERALRDQRVELAPGLLSRAHQGVLYVDEVNLLSDGLVDLLLDAAASGQNVIERDGVSHVHPARFVLVGTMNPEEGELRPQLLDRFGLCASAEAEFAAGERVEIVRRRLAFEREPREFRAQYAAAQQALLERCQAARASVETIPLAAEALEAVSERCQQAAVEGVRADLAMLRAARAHAAWQGRSAIAEADIAAVAELALAHRRGKVGSPHGGSGAGPQRPPSGGRAGVGPGSGGGAQSSAQQASGETDGSDAASDAERDGSAADGVESANASAARGSDESRLGSQSAAGWGAASSGSQRRAHAQAAARRGGGGKSGALAPIPVRALPPPPLPSFISAQHSPHSSPQRRGMSLTASASGARTRIPTTARTAPIDWFRTLASGVLAATAAVMPRDAAPQSRTRRYTLVRRERRAPSRQLWVLVLDCSASMLRGGALAAAKGVAHALELRALRAGAHVAVISFQGDGARALITSRAGRAALTHGIAALGGGGGTPLRAALAQAQQLCGLPAWRPRTVRKRLFLLTDGRTREPVDELSFRRAGLELLVIDCERDRIRLGRSAAIAAALGGSYHHVDSFT
jgi:magnesium chelatase subunit D